MTVQDKTIAAVRAEERARQEELLTAECKASEKRIDALLKDALVWKEMYLQAVNDRDIKLLPLLEKASVIIKPFANTVFNDNGDITVTTSDLKIEHYFAAYNWQKKYKEL